MAVRKVILIGLSTSTLVLVSLITWHADRHGPRVAAGRSRTPKPSPARPDEPINEPIGIPIKEAPLGRGLYFSPPPGVSIDKSPSRPFSHSDYETSNFQEYDIVLACNNFVEYCDKESKFQYKIDVGQTRLGWHVKYSHSNPLVAGGAYEFYLSPTSGKFIDIQISQ